jgi:hypothetical protein
MPASLVEGESLLAVSVGAATTRAAFFDIVEGAYRFVAAGQAPSMAEAPRRDVIEGVRSAIESLQAVIGRTFLDDKRAVIRPTNQEGAGVDGLVLTLSAGPALKTVLVGLLSDVSLESARRLAGSLYAVVADTVGLEDARPPAQIIDSLVRVEPDLVLISGGTDGGASTAIRQVLEPVGLASFLTPPEKRAAFLFAGNARMGEEVRSLLGSLASSMHISPNVRPSLETEDLNPAERELARVFINIRKQQMAGVDLLDQWSNGHLLPTSYATGRMMRFLSKVYGSRKGILSVDLGSSAAIVCAGFEGRSSLATYPQFGLGENLAGLLNHTTPEEILRWSSVDFPAGALRDFLHEKSIHPNTVPATAEERALSEAVNRQALHLATLAARRHFPTGAPSLRAGLMPLFDPILAGGAALTEISLLGESLLLLLDAVQPVGVTGVILDQNSLLPMLGAAAGRNSLLPVQVLESGAFLSLGTVVAPVISAPQGTPILLARLTSLDGTEARTEIRFGSIELLSLPGNQTGRLFLQPQRAADVGFGPGRSGTITVNGGALGVIFDGRGRPLELPDDGARRREQIKKWQGSMGGA